MSPEERADEAEALLKAPSTPATGYRGPGNARRGRIVQVAALLNPDDELDDSDLDDFRTSWKWLCRQDAIWEYWMPGHPPSDDMQTMVLDGRPDLDGDPPENLCLAGESIDAWVSVAHGHDGHVFEFWDTSSGTRIVTVDNSEPEPMQVEYDDLEQYLLERALPDMILRLRPSPKPDAPTPLEEAGCWAGCVGIVAVVVALGWWLWC